MKPARIGDGELRSELKSENIEITGWVERDVALRKSINFPSTTSTEKIHYKKFAFGNEVIKNGKVFWDRWLPWGSGH